jgi:hypothetical protein
MLLQPSEDQQFFRETTARFLDEFAPVNEVRRLRDDPAGYAPDYWRRGAELGWTSFLVDERHGGGSISGAGLVDLTLVAHEFGPRGPRAIDHVQCRRLARRNDAHPRCRRPARRHHHGGRVWPSRTNDRLGTHVGVAEGGHLV